MKKSAKEMILDHPKAAGLAMKLVNASVLKNSKKVPGGNTLKDDAVLYKASSIVVEGKGNIIEIGEFTQLSGCSISIRGDNNHLRIGKRCNFNATEFCIEDSGNEMIIGDFTTVQGRTQIAAIEGTRLEIGEDCMFSQDIYVRTGDSHSVVDAATGQRVNQSEDVVIGKHCWIGMNATVLKGAVIKDDSVVGASAVVTKKFDEGSCVLAGNPAKIIKRGTDWKRERI